MAQELVVLSPEKAIVPFRLAGLGARVGAHLVDGILATFLVIGFNFVVSLTLGGVSQGIASFILAISSTLILFLYFILLEGLWNGQTPGKKSAGIRVRMADGSAITFQAAVTRNLLRVADFLPSLYLAGVIAMFLNPRSQRLGDLAAGTVVIYERKRLPFFTPAPYALGVHRCEQYLPSLRKMTMEEYIALKRFCDRFPEFPKSVQEQTIREVWRPIALRLGIEELPEFHPISLAEATVMKYGREHGLL